MHATYNDLCYVVNFIHKHKSYRFRVDVVPGTAKFRPKHRYGHYFRYPKTIQEIRESFNYGGKFTRGKRRRKHLPTCWDDIPKYSRTIKSWKNCTKKRYQWMKKNNKSQYRLNSRASYKADKFISSDDNYIACKLISFLFDEYL